MDQAEQDSRGSYGRPAYFLVVFTWSGVIPVGHRGATERRKAAAAAASSASSIPLARSR